MQLKEGSSKFICSIAFGNRLSVVAWLLSVLLRLLATQGMLLGALPSGLEVVSGPVTGALIAQKVAVYSDVATGQQVPRWILLTHARSDLERAARPLIERGATAVIPREEESLFSRPEEFWRWWLDARFHDYSQVSTRVPYRALKRFRAVSGGELLNLDGIRVQVVSTPGYSRGAVSYLVNVGGKRVIFSGDLIYAPGEILDLYSLQDAIPELKVRGYHGYLARAGQLIQSLEKILDLKPDLLVPAHGEIIEQPTEAIQLLIERLRALARSHFRTDALLWYWGEENFQARARRVLGEEKVIPVIRAQQKRLPSWIIAIANSRLIVSASGAGFLIDGGSNRVPPAFAQLVQRGKIRSLEGIWVTHYHDDHTNYVSELARNYHCPVYFIEQMQDVLAHPQRYHLPCLTQNPIEGRAVKDGQQWRWREFTLTAHYFPGQTLYHGGLQVQRDDGEAVYFVGDSFTPTGMDDYCMQNRNLFWEELGYRRCLGILESLPASTWLINQHVEPMFQFNRQQLSLMRTELSVREKLIEQLVPWPGPDYGTDESWAHIYPYWTEAREGETLQLELRVLNHSRMPETFQVRWNLPEGWQLLEAQRTAKARPAEGIHLSARMKVTGRGLHIVTVDLTFRDRQLWEWTEALVQVQ